jgi:DNA-binding GntR family transcriptional regulator
MPQRAAHRIPPARAKSAGARAGRPPGRGIARYYHLYELLSCALNDGTISPGSALPSEPELVLRYRLSRDTVRRALARLEHERRIVRRRGSGTFALQMRSPATQCLNLHTYLRDTPALEPDTSVSILRFEAVAVPAPVQLLEPQIGARALLIQRVRRCRGAPYQLSTAYIPASIGRLILRKSLLGHASLVTILDQIGPRTVTTDHRMNAIAADAAAARSLRVALGTPLLRIRAVMRDSHGRLRAVYESLSRPDRFRVCAAFERNVTRGLQARWRLKTPPTRVRPLSPARSC